jgi:tetratricopeptide (TPR) repeat protein
MKKIRILFITIIFVIISSNAFSQEKQYIKGREAYNKGDYLTAISYFKECTKLAPKDEGYFRWLGYAYHQNRQYQEAIESYKNALNLSPNKNTDGWYWLAYAYYRLGQTDMAISSIKKMIVIAPDSSIYFIALSKFSRENKQYDEAITAAKRAIELKPDNSDAYIVLGAASGNNGQFEEAITALKKSIELNPKNIDAYGWMGNFLIQKNFYTEAAGVYKKAIENAADVPYVYFNLSRAYYSMGNYDEALTAINKVIELNTIQGGIGISFKTKDNYPVITELFDQGPAKRADLQIDDKIIAIDGNSAKTLNDEKIIPGLRGTAGSKVILTIKRSDKKITRTVVRENIILKTAASGIGFRSQIYRQKGDFNEASNDAKIASSLDSTAYDSRLSLGASYLDQNQYSESVRLLSELKDDPDASLLEATADAKQGKTSDAINVYLSIPEENLPSKHIPIMNDRAVLLQIFKPLVKEHLDNADSFESKNQYKEVLSELSEAMKIADDTEAPAILQSMFSIVRSNPMLSDVSEEARKYAIRGEMLTKDGNFEQAAKEYKIAIKIAPFNANLYYNAALMNGELKNYSEAIRYLKIYLQADPDSPNSRMLKDQIIKWEYLMEKAKWELL